MDATLELAHFVAATPSAAIPPEAREQARRAFLDTIGVTIAGCREDAASIVAGWIADQGGVLDSSVIGRGFFAPAANAALANGTSAHALDWDDVSVSMRGHPSVPLVPAILALGEKLAVPGAAAVDAYVLGFEVQARLGRATGPEHYALGWHATSTFGSIGAAAAASRMIGFDTEKTAVALALAASLASGLQANFGTMTKPFQAGWAAHNGITAATLAARGLTAGPRVLEALLKASSGDAKFDPAQLVPRLGDPWDIVANGIGVKLHPCCYATHRAIDATLEARDRMFEMEGLAFHPEMVERIEVNVSHGGLIPLIDRLPETGLEAKFSMAYCITSALLDGHAGLPAFTDDMVARPEAVELMQRVAVEDRLPAGDYPIGGEAEVRIETVDGKDYRARVEVPRGDPKRPLTWDVLAGKFRECVQDLLPPDRCQQVIAVVSALDDLPDIPRLMALLA